MNKPGSLHTALFIPFLVLILYGCGPKVAVRPGYDFKSINRIGVMKFDSSQVDLFTSFDPGTAVADEFVFQFLSRGVRVVERSRLEDILREQKLWKSGYIDPETIKQAGKILGVDAIILGTVLKYVPDSKKRIYIKDDNGKLQEEIFLVEAEVGISARMVDVVTGEIIWAGSYSYDSFYIDTAIRQAVDAIIKSLGKVWIFTS
ncbi:MAG: hypothetical protein JXJ19_00270 [Elusimicrobia bacterium]|nr:hypothetical protein [Elusimicrobiota bacterium]